LLEKNGERELVKESGVVKGGYWMRRNNWALLCNNSRGAHHCGYSWLYEWAVE